MRITGLVHVLFSLLFMLDSLAQQDSIVRIKVFLPDPISSAETNYGAPYVDFNDALYQELEDEHVQVLFPIPYINDTFRLENQFLKITELSAPTEAVWKDHLANTEFFRSQIPFESFHIFYHIMQFRAYMDSLGYDTLGKIQLNIDPHGLNGADNSSYLNTTSPPQLNFGQGGVDDAEDAGIIVHEYGHFLSDMASPSSMIGLERLAIDEGLCDYLAASYCRNLSTYRWKDLFKWDSHNEFNAGRSINLNAHYPENNEGSIYDRSVLISGLLMNIEEEINRKVAHQLCFGTMHQLKSHMSIFEFTQQLYLVNEQLFSGQYDLELCQVFARMGFGQACYPSSLSTIDKLQLRVLNSQEFARGNLPLRILLSPKAVNYSVLDLEGKILSDGNALNEIELDPDLFLPGIYYLFIESNRDVQILSVVRY